jgi:hypothetical protein
MVPFGQPVFQPFRIIFQIFSLGYTTKIKAQLPGFFLDDF